jgi:protein gp37
MSILSNNIGWCDDTGNKVTGCDKVSEGCKECYAQVGTRARVLRHGGDKNYPNGVETWGANGVRVPVKDFSTKVRRLNKLCICDVCHETWPVAILSEDYRCLQKGVCNSCGGAVRRIRFFADSNSDWLDEKWDIEPFAALLNDIYECPNIDFQLLTKRPENFGLRIGLAEQYLMEKAAQSEQRDKLVRWIQKWAEGKAPEWVWFGVSVENQKRADERIPQLMQIPAAVRFLSCEPLLEHVCLTKSTLPLEQSRGNIHWVIVGGESGARRRDCGVEPIVSIAQQCVAAGVPVYVKQDCDFKSGQQGRIPDEAWNLKQFPEMNRQDTKARSSRQN